MLQNLTITDVAAVIPAIMNAVSQMGNVTAIVAVKQSALEQLSNTMADFLPKPSNITYNLAMEVNEEYAQSADFPCDFLIVPHHPHHHFPGRVIVFALQFCDRRSCGTDELLRR